MTKHTIAVWLLLFSFTASASNPTCPKGETDSVLFFGNGMFNDIEDATESLVSLWSSRLFLKEYRIAYNSNEGALKQLLEVFLQKTTSDIKFKWSFISRFRGPKWFTKTIQGLSKTLSTAEYVNDDDLRTQVEDYSKILDAGDSVVIVSHSQGNLYSNAAYEYLVQHRPKQINRLEIVSVASPASYQASGNKYLTLKTDYLIRSIPTAMSYNTDNNSQGYLDHQFVKHYLSGSRSGPELLKLLDRAVTDANGTATFFEPGYVDKSLVKMNKWMAKVKADPKGHKLTKPQCLAASLFLKVANWWGEDCHERSLDRLRQHGQDCLEEWLDPDRIWFHCYLTGLGADAGVLRSPVPEMIFMGSHPQCTWNRITDEVSQEQLDQSLKFMEAPQ